MDQRFENHYGTEVCRTATHIYLLPHPALRPYIAHYTLCPQAGGFTAQAPQSLTLIPDASGCLVLTLSEEAPLARLYGPSTETVTITGDGGPTPPRFFAEFRPGGLFAFTGIPQGSLRDRVWDPEEVAPALFRALWEVFLRTPDLDEFLRGADKALCAAARFPAPALPMLSHLAANRGPTPVGDLARETGYSPRHLSRLLLEGAGMGSKSFVRVLRVNEAILRIRAGHPSLTTLAQELGYYDQSHFIHDFRTVCGASPGEYRRDLSDFYNEPLKF